MLWQILTIMVLFVKFTIAMCVCVLLEDESSGTTECQLSRAGAFLPWAIIGCLPACLTDYIPKLTCFSNNISIFS